MLNFRKNIKKISPAYFIRESEIQGLSNISTYSDLKEEFSKLFGRFSS